MLYRLPSGVSALLAAMRRIRPVVAVAVVVVVFTVAAFDSDGYRMIIIDFDTISVND